ncbi:MAG: aldo/keto reductase [Methanocorpusculum sp.]|nr:aldo/keto reductase [Methanocorpusculum sp.]
MLYRKIEHTNLSPSVIGLGCEWLDGKTEKEVREIFDFAIANGINYLDLFMPQPELRTNIGKALKGRREKIIIQGHLCTVFEDGQYNVTRDINKTKEAFEDLLSRLNTDYIDIGMLHFVDSEQSYREVFETEIFDYVKELKAKGTIKYVGLSSHNPIIALKAVQSGLIDVLMFSINPAFDFEDTETDVYDLIEFKGFAEKLSADSARFELYTECENRGVGITVMKAFAGGRLLSDKDSPFGKALTSVQCIEYALSRSGVKCVIAGCKDINEIKEAVSYCEASEEDKNYSQIFTENPRFAMSGKCMYCNHCKPCASNIDIAAVTKYLDLALMQDEVPKSVAKHYSELEFDANDCLQCGQCEKRCPFGVHVMENMLRAQRVFN